MVVALDEVPAAGWEADLPELKASAGAVQAWLADRSGSEKLTVNVTSSRNRPVALSRQLVAGPWQRRANAPWREAWWVAVDEEGRPWAAGPSWRESPPRLGS